MPIVDAILMELDQEGKVTQRVLERIPEDKLGWRPHPKSFSLGQLAMHIAEGQGRLAEIVQDDIHQVNITPPPEPNNRNEVLDAFAQSQSAAKAGLSRLDDAKMMATWTGQLNGKTILSLPRVAFVRFIMLNHIYHHRGQLSVYLRLLNVAVPSIYGPSADENPFAATVVA
jgi:uncharacterized damage-inducible protein DinB